MVGNSDKVNVPRYGGFLPEPQFGPANDFLLGYEAEHWRPTMNKKDADMVNMASNASTAAATRARA
jgi:hypothetical protein